ncbi:MAG TPA: hypothetical protein VN682_17885 [Terriglobales bacterium]|nr:hypothetical protein [Terriglobales bacterium]
MKRLKFFTVCCVAALALFFVMICTLRAQAPANKAVPAIVGTWKLNPDKSNLRVPADHVEIRQYSLRPDGFLVGMLITTDHRGSYHYLQFTAKSDGKDYPEYTDTLVADMIAAGKHTPRTYAETVLDEYTTDWTDKVNGKVTAHGKKIVSRDRKTLTVTVDGSSQMYVYDRE